MTEYNIQLAKDKESRWHFGLDMTVEHFDLVVKIMNMIMSDTNQTNIGNIKNSTTRDWRDGFDDLNSFIKPLKLGDNAQSSPI